MLTFCCLECITDLRKRDKEGNLPSNGQLIPQAKRSKGPVCSKDIRFVIMSSFWPKNTAEHVMVLKRHVERCRQTPCRYFQTGVQEWQENRRNDDYLFCPFGNRCFFAHTLPGSSSRYVFTTRQVTRMVESRQRGLQGREVHAEGRQVRPFHDRDSVAEDEAPLMELPELPNNASVHQQLAYYQRVLTDHLYERQRIQREEQGRQHAMEMTRRRNMFDAGGW